jgi:hypothetical protein
MHDREQLGTGPLPAERIRRISAAAPQCMQVHVQCAAFECIREEWQSVVYLQLCCQSVRLFIAFGKQHIEGTDFVFTLHCRIRSVFQFLRMVERIVSV